MIMKNGNLIIILIYNLGLYKKIIYSIFSCGRSFLIISSNFEFKGVKLLSTFVFCDSKLIHSSIFLLIFLISSSNFFKELNVFSIFLDFSGLVFNN